MKRWNFFFVLLLLAQSAIAGVESGPVRISEPSVIDRISREVTLNRISQKRYFAEEKENDSWRKKHPTAFGTLLGLGIGFGTGLAFGVALQDTEAIPSALVFGAVGAGIGALIGSFSEY
jgi:hypothetical protein